MTDMTTATELFKGVYIKLDSPTLTGSIQIDDVPIDVIQSIVDLMVDHPHWNEENHEPSTLGVRTDRGS